LGASAVLVGRPVIWGLATAGSAGVSAVLDLLRAELIRTLQLLGLESVSQLDASAASQIGPHLAAGRSLRDPCS
jgi:isopentenyl diphosphate isomerase/L-lactate dehydrogenase-like FMN-dependent dehydrogenase